MLVVYMINPGGDTEFGFTRDTNNNFNVGNETSLMQFYPDMRFPSSEISYKIDNECSLSKKDSMREALNIVENMTDISFYSVSADEEISIYCSEKVKFENRMFIAGEGGPTNITDGGKYRVILHGSLLLIKDSGCATPIVEVHELLHVLGFDHSDNKNNILYPVAKCRQTIGDDLVSKINDLYTEETYPDLLFEEASAEIKGRGLSLNLSIRNDGLKESETSIIKIYNKEKVIKEIELNSLDIGYGVKIELRNLWLTSVKTDEIKVLISTSFNELSKDNNEIILLKK